MALLDKNARLTTFQAARLLNVVPMTVINWANKGLLETERTAGGHRRIQIPALLKFLRTRGLPVPEALRHLDRPRILIVDDDATELRTMTRVLKPFANAVDVKTADNGIDALVEVGDFKPNLVILDVFMPNLDGLEVCRRLGAKEQTATMKVVIVSAHMTEALAAQALEAGASRALPKPYDVHEMLSLIGITPQQATTP